MVKSVGEDRHKSYMAWIYFLHFLMLGCAILGIRLLRGARFIVLTPLGVTKRYQVILCILHPLHHQ